MGRSPDTNDYFRAKLKVSVFENGQLNIHLILRKKFFKISKTFPHIKNLSKFLKEFFKKTKLLFIEEKMFFSPKTHFFSKIKYPLNCPFSKTNTFSFSLKYTLMFGPPPPHTHTYGTQIRTKPMFC